MFVALEIILTEQELQQSNGRSLPLFYICPASNKTFLNFRPSMLPATSLTILDIYVFNHLS